MNKKTSTSSVAIKRAKKTKNTSSASNIIEVHDEIITVPATTIDVEKVQITGRKSISSGKSRKSIGKISEHEPERVSDISKAATTNDRKRKTKKEKEEIQPAQDLAELEVAVAKDKVKKTKKKDKKIKKTNEETAKAEENKSVEITAKTEIDATDEAVTAVLPKKVIAPPPGFEEKSAENNADNNAEKEEIQPAQDLTEPEIAVAKDKVKKTKKKAKKIKKTNEETAKSGENKSVEIAAKTEIDAIGEAVIAVPPKKVIAPPPGFEEKSAENNAENNAEKEEIQPAQDLTEPEIAVAKDKDRKTKKKAKKIKKTNEGIAKAEENKSVEITAKTEIDATDEAVTAVLPKKVIAPPPGFEEKSADNNAKKEEIQPVQDLAEPEVAVVKDKVKKIKKKDKKIKKTNEETAKAEENKSVEITAKTEIDATDEAVIAVLPKKVIAPPPGFEEKSAENNAEKEEIQPAQDLAELEVAVAKYKVKKIKKKDKKIKKTNEETAKSEENKSAEIAAKTEIDATGEAVIAVPPKKVIAPPPGFEEKSAENNAEKEEIQPAQDLAELEVAVAKDKVKKIKKKDRKTKKTNEETAKSEENKSVEITAKTKIDATDEAVIAVPPKKVIAPPPGFEEKTNKSETIKSKTVHITDKESVKPEAKTKEKTIASIDTETQEKPQAILSETEELYQLLNQLDARRSKDGGQSVPHIIAEAEKSEERKESRWARRRKKRQEKMLLLQQQTAKQPEEQVVEKQDDAKDSSSAPVLEQQNPRSTATQISKNNKVSKTDGLKQQEVSGKKTEVQNKHKERKPDSTTHRGPVEKAVIVEKKDISQQKESVQKKQKTPKVYSVHKNKKLPLLPDDIAPLVDSVERFIKSTLFIPDEASLLLGVSGGVDSVVMLDVMSNLAQRHGYQLTVAHCNHGLRDKESDLDEKFTRALAADYRAQFYSIKVNAAAHARNMRTSIENAARTLRYQFFERAAKSIGARFVLSAHTADDTAETLLLNLIRGAGLTGLAGIPPRRDLAKKLHLVRPFLQASKSELIAYAKKRPLEWREDKSNASTLFMRNKIRHDLLPKLRDEYSPAISEILVRTARILQGAEAVVGDRVEKLSEVMTTQNAGEIRLAISFFETISEFLQGEVIQHIIRKLGGRPVSMNAINRIIALKKSELHAESRVSGHITAIRDRADIVFTTVEPSEIYANITVGETFDVGPMKIRLSECSKKDVQFIEGGFVEFFDAATLPQSLVLRNWRAGDSFRPLGLGGSMNISNFLTNIKVSAVERKRTLVLCAGGEIVWVCGKRISDKFKITSATKRAIRAEIIQ